MSMDVDIDYESLKRALEEVLSLVSHLRINPHSLQFHDEFSHVYGGYAEILCATFEEGKEPQLPATHFTGRVVAVKQLRSWGGDAERTRIAVRLAREIRVWASLQHPNVLPLVGFYLSEDRNVAWLVSSYQPHGNIAQYIQKARPSMVKRLALLTDTAQGLSYLHSLDPPICHGDIKAANVLVTDELTAALCDFGLSRAVQEEYTGLTTSRTLKGSLRYLSPELLDEDPIHTLASDVWAWGCLTLEVVDGSIPHAKAKSEQGIILEIARGRAPANISTLQLPDNIHTILLLCWKHRAESRPNMPDILDILTHRRQPRGPGIQDSPLEEQLVKGDRWSASYNPELIAAFEMDSRLEVGWVQCLRFSNDGSLFAVGYPNGVVQLYDTETGVPLGSLDPFPQKSHREPVNNISFSPDGRYLAADGNKKIRVWDLARFKVQQILRCPTSSEDSYLGNSLLLAFAVMDVSWTRRLAAASGRDNVLRIWNIDTRAHKLLFRYKSAYDDEDIVGMGALTFSPDGSLLAVGSHDGAIRIWDTGKLSLVQAVEIRGHTGPIKSLVFSSPSLDIISSGEDRSIKVWTRTSDTCEGYQCMNALSLPQTVDWIDISTDGRWLLSASRYGELCVLDMSSGASQLTIKLEAQRSKVGKFHHNAFCPVERGMIAVGDHIGRTTLWEYSAKTSPQSDRTSGAA